jgi:formylmethanofuran dehydrogenase subunit E
VPLPAKRLLTIIQTDSRFADGVSAATNGWAGTRMWRVNDFGKVAATFVDTQTGRAWVQTRPSR